MLQRPVELAQYTSRHFASLADRFGIRLSVGRTGRCWDNALAESFFATIKRELLDTTTWPSRAAARTAIFDFIEGWYNLHRLQQPRLPQSRRLRDRTRSLTTTPMVSVKAEQAHGGPLVASPSQEAGAAVPKPEADDGHRAGGCLRRDGLPAVGTRAVHRVRPAVAGRHHVL
ncbi:integrase core domain-containing protein [Streptomyces sp. NBC_01190]|uniref:integrase core domain-containing protein n=1 Tax=Streptomyces sp. NBC_01190 TaxID=2903767 RepID=UPI0038705E8D